MEDEQPRRTRKHGTTGGTEAETLTKKQAGHIEKASRGISYAFLKDHGGPALFSMLKLTFNDDHKSYADYMQLSMPSQFNKRPIQ